MITVDSQLQADDIKSGLIAINNNNRSLLVLKYIGIVQIVLGLATIVLGLVGDKPNYSGVWMIGVGLFFAFLMNILASIQVKKIIQASKAITEKTTYQFTSDGYEAKAGSYSAKNTWQNVYMVKEEKKLVLLFTTSQIAVIVKKDGFLNFAEFKTLIKSIPGLKSKWL